MEIWASAQVPSPRSDLISQNERRGRARGPARAQHEIISLLWRRPAVLMLDTHSSADRRLVTGSRD